MNCPHCAQPIPDAAVVKAAASINGTQKRPGAKGLVRNGCHHFVPSFPLSGKDTSHDYECLLCRRTVRYSEARRTFLLVRNPNGRKPKEETK